MPTRKIVLLEGDRASCRDIAMVGEDTFALWGRQGDVDLLTIDAATWVGDSANLRDADVTEGPLSVAVNGNEVEVTITFGGDGCGRLKFSADDDRVRILVIELHDLDSARPRDYC